MEPAKRTEGEVLEIYLHPGDSYVARQPAVIRTILGSCVGVTFWSGRIGAGALCHAQLPRAPARPLTAEAGRRFVDFAIRDIAREFDGLGARRGEVQVKLFGGADVLQAGEESTRKPTVGRMNYETAIEVARAEGLQVVASSLGGTSGLHIQFDTRTGEVLLRRLV
jgi:chemotaxis protein CheD